MSAVTSRDLEHVYQTMQTPYKKGWVLWEEGVSIDCATVFRHGGEWRMVYARHDARVAPEKQGYETWMARSDDLMQWQPMGRLLSQRFEGWDGLQCDGGLLLLDPAWQGGHSPEQVDGRYWMSYIGGALPGYEPDPLHMGMAFSPQLDTACEWQRLKEPVLRMDDADVRDFERSTLYKSCAIHDRHRTLGAPYVMFYNAKQPPYGVEEIGMALSHDMVHWRRYGESPVVQSGIAKTQWSIAGDPQIIRFEDMWVMHYFVAHGKPEGGIVGYDTFAVSRDLVNWARWEGQPLVAPSTPYDKTCAHKPFVLCHQGVVYHFYCAVGDQGRGLALATSRP